MNVQTKYPNIQPFETNKKSNIFFSPLPFFPRQTNRYLIRFDENILQSRALQNSQRQKKITETKTTKQS